MSKNLSLTLKNLAFFASKKSSIIILSILAVFVVVQTASAQTTYPVVTRGMKATEKATMRAEKLSTRLESLRTRGLGEVDRRIESLNKLISRISEMKRLTTEQKTTFTTDIQGQVTNLTTLRAKIEAGTDAETLRTDVKSVRDSYRIYALYMPKIRILAAVDVLNTAYLKLSELAAKLDTRIQAAKTAGNDTATLEATLAIMKTELESAKVNFEAAGTVVLPLTPDGYPDNKTQLQDAQAKIKAAHEDMKSAREAARAIIQGLKSLNKTPSATSTPTL